MSEKKDNYLKAYLKENLVVLLFELIIVVLLACICSLMLGGQPVWLSPVLAVFAYLMAELRFMMSYIATCTRGQREAAQATEQLAADDTDAEDLATDAEEEQTDTKIPPLEDEVDDEESLPDQGEAPRAEPEDGAPAFEPLDDPFGEPLNEPLDEPLDEPTGDDTLFVADIDLFDEPLGKLGEQDDVYIADIDAPDHAVQDEPKAEPALTAEAWRAAFGVPIQDILDTGESENPYAH